MTIFQKRQEKEGYENKKILKKGQGTPEKRLDLCNVLGLYEKIYKKFV